MAQGKDTFHLLLTNNFGKMDITTLICQVCKSQLTKLFDAMDSVNMTWEYWGLFTLAHIHLFHQQTLIECRLGMGTVSWEKQRKQGIKQVKSLTLKDLLACHGTVNTVKLSVHSMSAFTVM